MTAKTADSSDTADQAADTTTAESKGTDPERLRAQIVTLQAENRRLRQEYSRARQSQHRRTATGLAIVGSVAVLAALLFPEERTVLLAIGGTGLFGAVLTAFLTPERFVPATVGELVYGTSAENQERLLDTLGLQEDRIYVPAATEQSLGVRLFVPHQREFELPDGERLDQLFVLPEEPRERGVSVRPTGAALYDEFRTGLAGEPSDSPERLSQQVADALVETFELADSVTTDVSENQLTASITGSAYGDVNRFDHPISSLFATALAAQLSSPVELEVHADDGRADVLVVCRWDISPSNSDSRRQ